MAACSLSSIAPVHLDIRDPHLACVRFGLGTACFITTSVTEDPTGENHDVLFADGEVRVPATLSQ